MRVDNLHLAIAECRGAIVTLWEYTVSLSQLTIRVTRPGERGNLHLVFNGCQRVEADSSWIDADLQIQVRGDLFTLTDARAKCLIEYGSLRVLRNVEPLFLESR